MHKTYLIWIHWMRQLSSEDVAIFVVHGNRSLPRLKGKSEWVHTPKGPQPKWSKSLRWSQPFMLLMPYERKLREEKKKKTPPWELCPVLKKLRGTEVFALLMAFSKCVDTQVGLGEQFLHVGNTIWLRNCDSGFFCEKFVLVAPFIAIVFVLLLVSAAEAMKAAG